ncbi:uncharacterized protein KIAA2013 homolog isoform X1 [Styela clava]
MLKIRPSAAKLQIPMAQQNISQMTLSFSLRSLPVTRRTIAFGITACIFFIYLGPFFYRNVLSLFTSQSNVDSCLAMHLKQHDIAIGELDAYINDHNQDEPSQQNRPPLQFVGNGKLGAIVKDSSSLYIFYPESVQHTDNKKQVVMREEIRTFKLPFSPILQTRHMFSSDSEKSSSVINFREGIVERLSCLKIEGHSGCVFLNHTAVAHRSRPNVFLQHISASLDGSSRSIGDKTIKILSNDIDASFNRVSENLFNHKPYKLHSNVLEISQGKFMAISVASKLTGDNLQINNDNANHVDAMTVVMHSGIKNSKDLAKLEEGKLQKQTAEYANIVMEMSTDELLKEHRAAWKDILHTGLTVSPSEDEPGLPDPRIVNETIYYVLSSSDSKLHDEGIPENERRNLINRLQTPDFCYQGHSTISGKSLWSHVTSVEDVANLQRLWSLTLSKHQCKSLVSEGAEGLLQAMLLSFGGLKFTENDLRFGPDPEVLHNDISFHRLIYRNDTLDISVKRARDSTGTPVIMVALRDHPKIPLYACEAGCVRDAVELGVQAQELPVYVTDPVTPILYISHDRKHLSDLRDTLHVKKILEHAQHMEEVRKGTGLPTIFWIGIGSLIVFFHLFLIRLICNEYNSSYKSPVHFTGVASGNAKYTNYSNRGRLAS